MYDQASFLLQEFKKRLKLIRKELKHSTSKSERFLQIFAILCLVLVPISWVISVVYRNLWAYVVGYSLGTLILVAYLVVLKLSNPDNTQLLKLLSRGLLALDILFKSIDVTDSTDIEDIVRKANKIVENDTREKSARNNKRFTVITSVVIALPLSSFFSLSGFLKTPDELCTFLLQSFLLVVIIGVGLLTAIQTWGSDAPNDADKTTLRFMNRYAYQKAHSLNSKQMTEKFNKLYQ